MWTPEGVKAIASLVTAVAWPLLALVAISLFAPQLRDLLTRLSDFEAFGVKAKVTQRLNESAQAAEHASEPDRGPTPEDRRRAAEVEALTAKAPLAFVRSQAEQLAAEYERVRASMPSSDKRTRAMEVVVAKMRTIGRSALPLRYELSASASPGHRLQAIVSLQLAPDFEMLDWLAERVVKEVPFIGYHALVALNAAAEHRLATDHRAALEQALAVTETARSSFGRDTSRIRQFETFEARVRRLGQPSAAAEPGAPAEAV